MVRRFNRGATLLSLAINVFHAKRQSCSDDAKTKGVADWFGKERQAWDGSPHAEGNNACQAGFGKANAADASHDQQALPEGIDQRRSIFLVTSIPGDLTCGDYRANGKRDRQHCRMSLAVGTIRSPLECTRDRCNTETGNPTEGQFPTDGSHGSALHRLTATLNEHTLQGNTSADRREVRNRVEVLTTFGGGAITAGSDPPRHPVNEGLTEVRYPVGDARGHARGDRLIEWLSR